MEGLGEFILSTSGRESSIRRYRALLSEVLGLDIRYVTYDAKGKKIQSDEFTNLIRNSNCIGAAISKDIKASVISYLDVVDDTAIDLAVICSILSSDQNIELDTQICFAGEIGLSGEIRAVNRIEQRIAEAEKLGYKQIVISKYNNLNSKDFKIKISKFGKIEEVFRLLFG